MRSSPKLKRRSQVYIERLNEMNARFIDFPFTQLPGAGTVFFEMEWMALPKSIFELSTTHFFGGSWGFPFYLTIARSFYIFITFFVCLHINQGIIGRTTNFEGWPSSAIVWAGMLPEPRTYTEKRRWIFASELERHPYAVASTNNATMLRNFPVWSLAKNRQFLTSKAVKVWKEITHELRRKSKLTSGMVGQTLSRDQLETTFMVVLLR